MWLQGNCASSLELPNVPGPELAPLRPGQCILMAQEDMLTMYTADIWLDNLYLRALYVNPVPGREDREIGFVALAAVAVVVNGTRAGTAARYMSRMTFQGDDWGPTVGVFADEKVYVEGAAVSHFH